MVAVNNFNYFGSDLMWFSNKANSCLEWLCIKSIKYVKTLHLGKLNLKFVMLCSSVLTGCSHLETELQGWVSSSNVQII